MKDKVLHSGITFLESKFRVRARKNIKLELKVGVVELGKLKFEYLWFVVMCKLCDL